MPHPLRAVLLTATLTLGTAALALAAVSEVDREFIEQAAMGGHEEVSTGQTAAESENPAIAAFGRQMVEDHTKMNDELASIAKGLGVTLPDSPSLMQQAEGAAVGVLPGATFDKTYVNQQLDDHQETLELLQNQLRNGQDPQLKSFAEKYIPVVERHIAELDQLKQRPELQ